VTGRPHVFVIAGPNGAGKSTAAPALLRDLLGVAEYVNADLIAQGLSAFDPQSVAFQAGRVMLGRLRQLAARRRHFAFETTLATRGYLPWLRTLRADGFAFDLAFLWLPSPEMAVARVAERVCRGGHDVPEAVIRRRYARGLQNFFRLYRPRAPIAGGCSITPPRMPPDSLRVAPAAARARRSASGQVGVNSRSRTNERRHKQTRYPLPDLDAILDDTDEHRSGLAQRGSRAPYATTSAREPRRGLARRAVWSGWRRYPRMIPVRPEPAP
jgi:predicted ABC-type ATPase